MTKRMKIMYVSQALFTGHALSERAQPSGPETGSSQACDSHRTQGCPQLVAKGCSVVRGRLAEPASILKRRPQSHRRTVFVDEVVPEAMSFSRFLPFFLFLSPGLW